MPLADVLVAVLVVVMTVAVVVAVIALHVWGAIQDGREENAMREQRRRRR
jgi:phosphotransferase system  glucose/maltose/N-acetylglucosamine-specific IIC component